MLTWEKFAPSYVGKGGFAPIMRLTGVIGLGAGFFMFYQRSICVFPLVTFAIFPLTSMDHG